MANKKMFPTMFRVICAALSFVLTTYAIASLPEEPTAISPLKKCVALNPQNAHTRPSTLRSLWQRFTTIKVYGVALPVITAAGLSIAIVGISYWRRAKHEKITTDTPIQTADKPIQEDYQSTSNGMFGGGILSLEPISPIKGKDQKDKSQLD